jgi:hypothetical protein
VVLNPYSQVEFETNRYSVPAEQAYRNLVLKAYPFRVDIQFFKEVIASHPRCYGHKQDILIDKPVKCCIIDRWPSECLN